MRKVHFEKIEALDKDSCLALGPVDHAPQPPPLVLEMLHRGGDRRPQLVLIRC